jgi:hypothetical protein
MGSTPSRSAAGARKNHQPLNPESWTAWQNQQLRGITADVLALASELRKGTIERVLGMSDLELGLQYLLGRQS